MTAPQATPWQAITDAYQKAASEQIDPVDLPEQIEADTTLRFSDGRVFHISEGTTARQDIWIMTRLDRVGLDAVLDIPDANVNLTDVALRLIERAYNQGLLFEIMAGMLTEEGVKWTQDAAKVNAEYFADLTNPADKAALNGPMASLLLTYFASGLASMETSLKSSTTGNEGSEASPSSETPEPVESSLNAPSADVPDDVLRRLHAAGSTVVSGTPLPEKSPDTISTGLTQSLTGPSENSASPSSS